MVAVLAHRHDIPFYVACPLSTIDLATADGSSIPIEERAADEVLGYGAVRWAAAGVSVRNPHRCNAGRVGHRADYGKRNRARAGSPQAGCAVRMNADNFRLLIEMGDLSGIRRALKSEPALANQTIRWVLNQQNESDPCTLSATASVTGG